MRTRTIFAVAVAIATAGTAAADERPNFLFVAIDDLNDFCGFASEEPGNYLQTIYPDQEVRNRVRSVLTPHLDRLAAESTPFLRASCVSALCGPSRTSLLTGVPPHRSGYYLHDRHFRLLESLSDRVTLPEYLKSNGYFTAGLGKVFHAGRGTVEGELKDDWADARNSWSRWINVPLGCNGGQPSELSPPGGGLMQFGPSRLGLRESGDWLAADFTARLVQHGEARAAPDRRTGRQHFLSLPEDRPFFLACGLFRPHLPFFAPKEYFDRFPTAEMRGLDAGALAATVADLDDLPSGAQRFSDHGQGKMKTVLDHGGRVAGRTGAIRSWRETVQAYLACVAFADSCVGRLMEGLDASPHKSNTVVVLWSDHGYHLGAKYHFAKQALWEEANRVTLLVRDPRIAGSCDGRPRRQIVSLADLYPSVVDLAGLPVPEGVSGRSLRPLLEDADAPELHESLLMTYQEGNHCLRTPQHRFSRYRDGSMELYDIIDDPGQRDNLAESPAHRVLIESLAEAMDEKLSLQ